MDSLCKYIERWMPLPSSLKGRINKLKIEKNILKEHIA